MDNEPKLEIDIFGNKRWYLHNKLHRVDGPAIELSSGHKQWRLNDKLHRVDGHALEYANGTKEWWLNNKHYSFDKWLEANTAISEEEKVMLKLTHG
jgi:hypothetical protein